MDRNALGNITIMGVRDGVSRVQMNQLSVDVGQWRLDVDRNLLEIKGLDEMTQQGAWEHDWTLSWA